MAQSGIDVFSILALFIRIAVLDWLKKNHPELG
jgi:hypothetical protein